MGRRSRCTPSRDISGPLPPPPSLPVTLSISSRKIIPDCSTFSIASLTTFSISTRRWASSWTSSSMASETLTFRFFPPPLPGMKLPRISHVDPHLLHAGVGEDLHHGHGLVLDLHVHVALIQLAVA